MQPTVFNQTILVTGADFMTNDAPINALMSEGQPFNRALAMQQHADLISAFKAAGITVIQKKPPVDCQDGVFPANHALIRGDKALLARLPNVRKAEEAYAKSTLQALGKEVFEVPERFRFSGQGDSLLISLNQVISGTTYRTSPEVHAIIEETLGYTVYSVQTIPSRDPITNEPIVNSVTGWPDSPFYDLDLSIAVLQFPSSSTPGLIGWCRDAFVPASQNLLASLPMNKIEVSMDEALSVGACNLVSTGTHVIMNQGAPQFKAAIEAAGLEVTAVNVSELNKNGGGVRCSSLTLDN